MSMFGRSNNNPQPATPAATPAVREEVTRTTTSTDSGTNVIAKGTTIKGDVDTTGNLRLEGKVKGHLRCTGTLTLGQGAIVEGDLIATKAELSGEVNGNVEVSELLTLKATANIKGDIFTSKLVIEVGAVFNGNCNMGAATKQLNLGQQAAGK